MKPEERARIEIDKLRYPDVIAQEIAENLEDALAQFSGITFTLGNKHE